VQVSRLFPELAAGLSSLSNPISPEYWNVPQTLTDDGGCGQVFKDDSSVKKKVCEIMSAETPLLQMRGITKHFGGLRALEQVDFDVYPGEVVALIGENGAGKSTLIKIVTGIYTADRGTIHYKGQPVTIRSRRDSQELGIEVLYQDLSLVGVMNAAQNVFLGKELTKEYLGFIEVLDNKRMQEEAERILMEQLGMDFRGRWEPVFQMSGGQRQAVALARAIYAQASLVILDEPMASLGVEEINRTMQIIQRLRDANIAVIVISHNLEHVFAVADRLVVLRAGRKVGDFSKSEGSPEEAVRLMLGQLPDKLLRGEFEGEANISAGGER
jgi:ABC-type sugar transport system ATPase subunit